MTIDEAAAKLELLIRDPWVCGDLTPQFLLRCCHDSGLSAFIHPETVIAELMPIHDRLREEKSRQDAEFLRSLPRHFREKYLDPTYTSIHSETKP